MELVDTSIWIEHFRRGMRDLADRLSEGLVLTHPWVCGELACGYLKNRAAILSDLAALPLVQVATDAEVLHLIEERGLWGRGLGWVDCHLITSALLSHCRLWTLDKKLAQAVDELHLY
jgi:predicted nucleic acid-binding protein